MKNLLATITIALAATAMPAAEAAAQTFAHYKGYANTGLGSNGMQKVHEVHYYYYVQGNKSVSLALPLANYTGSGSDTEPYGYYRWYDYSTDMASARLNKDSSSSSWSSQSRLNNVSDADGNNRGLFAYNLTSAPTQTSVGVKYTAPSDADSENWSGETIACDVSRYNDFGGGSSTTMTAEPTLSYRCIFHIMSAKSQAAAIVNSTATDRKGKYADLTIEDNRRILFGAKDKNSKLTLRTVNPADRYWFYPLTDNTRKHVYAATAANNITAADYNTASLLQATSILWRAYDQTKTKYTTLASYGSQMMNSTAMSTVTNNSNGWYDLNGQKTTAPTIDYGSIVYFVAYATNGYYTAPIANFEVLYQNTYPKTRAEILADGDTERSIDYLDSHYKQAMQPISFDADNDELDLTAPTSADNNMSRLPSRWDKRTYGFVYRALGKQQPTKGYGYQLPYSPIHGEYGLYKSANLSGVSTSSQGYQWWAASNITVYDRTYEYTNGAQYGYFLYVDASDESRQIAAADFKANLCSGARLIFSGAVADYTAAGATQPQIMFHLYGIIHDDTGNITDQRLITSFSSGDFNGNVSSRQMGKWFQVYSKLVLPRNSGAENYSDFRIVIDNMCDNTNGADYCIDDLRLYIQPAKVDVVQNQPLCPSENGYADTPDHITLKLRANYDNMQAMVGNKASHVFYRICDETGQPVSNIDYDGDGQPDQYGTAEIPAAYDETKMLPTAAAGGRTMPMFEKDAQNDILILFANRYFNLAQSKKFYISVAYPDEDDETKPGTWGVNTNACSTYSEPFQIVEENIVITDNNGSVVTAIRVSCDSNRTPNVTINAKVETADFVNGGKITLGNVKFDWFMSEPDKDNTFAQTEGLQEALAKYREAYPNETGLNTNYQLVDATGYALLKQWVDAGLLVLAASNNLGNYKFESGKMGVYKIAAIPIATAITEGKVTYSICPDPMYFSMRVVEDGPKLVIGFKDVVYPNDNNRTVRIGLPQIKAMKQKGGYLKIDIASLTNSTVVTHAEAGGSNVYISDSNDPIWDNTKQIIGTVLNDQITTGDSYIKIQFADDADKTLREGYWYELNYSYQQVPQRGETTITCPGELFVTLKVVPEYLTWNSSQDNALNANWNNDLNWLRSTAAQLYKTDYEDSDAKTAYTPMKFSKVTIVDQTGRVYPNLGNITYRNANGMATKLSNANGDEATRDIAYDMAVTWNDNTADNSDTGDGTFSCEKFKGNLCDAIYFKPHTELLGQCYLVYNKAYVEKEVEPRKWYLMSSPLNDTYAGDMYVPADNGRQETEAFEPISYSSSNNRGTYPIYQRNWDSHANQYIDGLTYYEAYAYDGKAYSIDTISDASLNINSLYWSHVYNDVSVGYRNGSAFSIKAGDNYCPTAISADALIRLPKADTQYAYTRQDGTTTGNSVTVDKTQAHRLLVAYDNSESALATISQPLGDNIHAKDGYYLVGNPYTASVSAYQFLKGNPSFSPKIWTIEADKVTAYQLDSDTGTSERYKDVAIEPMQAFFVKLRDGAEAPENAVFTAAMTTSRWVTGGTSTPTTNATLLITATDGQKQSTAKVVVREEANNAFDDSEDVEMLDNTDLSGVPTVYTVASDQAATLNQTTAINWMPIGIVAKQSKAISVTFGRNAKLKDEIYLFDSKTKQFCPISDSTQVTLQANEHGRYFITRQGALPNITPTGIINCYAPGNCLISVSSIADNIDNIKVYDLGGTTVTGMFGRNSTTGNVKVPAPGVYIVKATVAGKTQTFKLNVK